MPTYSKYSGMGGSGGIQSINSSTIPSQSIVGSGDVTVSTVIGTGVTTVSLGTPLSTFANTSLSNLANPTALNQVLRGQDGTAAAPAYSFTSSTGTGVYLASANNLAVSTGGVERMRFRSDGAISIGDVFAAARFNIYGATGVLGNGINLYETSTGTGKRLLLYQDTDRVVYDATFGTGGNAHAFNVGSVESARIDSSGRLLVGTDSFGTFSFVRLRVASNTNTAADFAAFNNTSTGAGVYLSSARGTQSAPTATQSGDLIGYVSARGYGATAFPTGGRSGINFVASENWTDSAQGAEIRFRTTAATGSTTNEKMVLTSVGDLLVGAIFTTARANFNSGTTRPRLQVEGADNNQSSLSITDNNNAASLSPSIYFGKTRGGAIGGNTIVQNNDQIGALRFQGSDGTNLVQSSIIRSAIDGTPSATSMPSRLEFYTAADGTTSVLERMRINNAGNVGIGTASPSARLHIQSDFGGVNDALIINNGSTNATAGRGSKISFTGTGNTTIASIESQTSTTSNTEGSLWFRAIGASGIQSFTTNGSERLRIDNFGNVGIGSVFGSGLATLSQALQVAVDGNLAACQVQSWNNTSPSFLRLLRARGTATAPLALNANDKIGSITMAGYSTGFTQVVGQIEVCASENFTATANGSYLTLSTTANGTQTLSERMRIDNAGNVGIGTQSPSSALSVKGETRLFGATSGYVGIQSTASPTSYTLTLPSAQGGANTALVNDGSGNLTWSSTVLASIFGDGSDGDLTVSNATTTSGPLSSGSLTRDAYFNNLTITSSGQINTNGWRLFVKGTLDVSGATGAAIVNNGAAAGNATGATAGAAGVVNSERTVGAGIAGAAGGTGGTGAGAAGSSVFNPVWANGGLSSTTNTNGKGGTAGANAGGNGGTASGPAPVGNRYQSRVDYLLISAAIMRGGVGGNGGGSGGGDGTNAGGGGGGGAGGGGVVYIAANSINRSSSNVVGTIRANGGAGGTGAAGVAGNAAGGGGGGGGGGGFVYLIYSTLAGTSCSNCISVDGGNGGTGGNGVGTGGGGNGGAGGGSGMITSINLATATGTVSGGNGAAVAGNAATGATGGTGGTGTTLRATL